MNSLKFHQVPNSKKFRAQIPTSLSSSLSYSLWSPGGSFRSLWKHRETFPHRLLLSNSHRGGRLRKGQWGECRATETNWHSENKLETNWNIKGARRQTGKALRNSTALMEFHVQDQPQVSKRTMFSVSLQGSLDSKCLRKRRFQVSSVDLVWFGSWSLLHWFCWALDARTTRETSPSTFTKLPWTSKVWTWSRVLRSCESRAVFFIVQSADQVLNSSHS